MEASSKASIHKRETGKVWGTYWGYMELMEKKMETTIMGLDRDNGKEPLAPRPSPVSPKP